MGEIELASRWLSGRIVAITGTKGKSTTTTLTGRMFTAGGRKALVGGNIGTPLSSQVADSTPETFHIVEVSSFQLETIETFHPWVAVFLNLSPDHLDRHASFEDYAQAKARIFANQTEDDWAVINADDPQTLAFAQGARRTAAVLARKVRRLISAPSRTRARIRVPLVPLSSIRLIGRHLIADVMAAAAVARLAGISPDAMTRAVESFTGLEHALEPVADDRRRAFRERFEGDQRRGRQARDRELRAPGWWRSSAGASRAAISACLASRCDRGTPRWLRLARRSR